MSDVKHGIAWNDSYILGDDKVDEQHRQLFSLLSGLVASCMDGSGAEKLQETLDFLVGYTVQHFNDEEAWQIEHDFPDYLRHKQKHEDFKVTVLGLVAKFKENGSSEELSMDVNKIVVRWLIQHINGEDRKIAEHIRSMA